MSLPSINCEIALEIFAALRQKLGEADPGYSDFDSWPSSIDNRRLNNQTYIAFAVSNKTVFNEFLTLVCKNLTIKFFNTYYLLENANIRLLFEYDCLPTFLYKFIKKLDIRRLSVFIFEKTTAEPESILKVFNAVYEQCDSLFLKKSSLTDELIFKIATTCKRLKSLFVDIELFRILIENHFVTFSELESLTLSGGPGQMAIKCRTCPTPKVTMLKIITLNMLVWPFDNNTFPSVKSLQMKAIKSAFAPQDMQSLASFVKRFPTLANVAVNVTYRNRKPLKTFCGAVHEAFKRTDFGVPINFMFKNKTGCGLSEKAELEKIGFKPIARNSHLFGYKRLLPEKTLHHIVPYKNEW